MSQKDKDTDNQEATASAEAAEDTKAAVTDGDAEESDGGETEAASNESAEAADSSGAEANEEADDSEADASASAEDAEEAESDDAESDEAESDEEAEESAETSSADDEEADGSPEDEAAATDGSDDGAEPERTPQQGELYGLLAEFDSPGALIAAAEKVRDAGFTQWDCYSPFPVHGIDPAMGIKRTKLPWIVFGIGLCGLGGGLFLQWWANAYNWPWIVSGKPFFSLPANIPITFETTILASAFATFFSMWILNKLPQVWHPLFKKDRFLKATDDGFFIGVEAADPKFRSAKTEALLRGAGAMAIEPCHLDPDPNRRNLPKALTAFILVTAALALIPLALVAKARHSKSPDPHVHIFPDMDFQPKAKAQNASDLFSDSRASRVPVEGTVARGQLKDDDSFFRGIDNGQWVSTLPAKVPVSKPVLERGQERYGIYCQPCHGADGRGNGIVHERTKRLPPDARADWRPPSNLIDATIVRQPHGQIFNTISNGIRTMPAYAAQIPEKDRWAIVLYVRALQRSQNASLPDVPAESRSNLQ